MVWLENGDRSRPVVEYEAFAPVIHIFLAHLTVAVATPDAEVHGSDSDSVPSECLDHSTLGARSVVPTAMHRCRGNSHMGMGER